MGLVISRPWQGKPLPWHTKLFQQACPPYLCTCAAPRVPSCPPVSCLTGPLTAPPGSRPLIPSRLCPRCSLCLERPPSFFLWQLMLKSPSSSAFSVVHSSRPLQIFFIGCLLQTPAHVYDSTHLLMALYLQNTGNSWEADGDILVMRVSASTGLVLGTT